MNRYLCSTTLALKPSNTTNTKKADSHLVVVVFAKFSKEIKEQCLLSILNSK